MKSYTGYRLVRKSVTLNNLEQRNDRYYALFYRIRQYHAPITTMWLKTGPIMSGQNMSKQSSCRQYMIHDGGCALIP